MLIQVRAFTIGEPLQRFYFQTLELSHIEEVQYRKASTALNVFYLPRNHNVVLATLDGLGTFAGSRLGCWPRTKTRTYNEADDWSRVCREPRIFPRVKT